MRISSLPRIAIQKAGSLIGRRRTLNFIEGSNVTLTVQDDAGNKRVNCTIASSGGGGGSAALTQLIPYTAANYYRSQYWSVAPNSNVFPGSGDIVVCLPVQVAAAVSIDRLRASVHTAVAGKNALLALYQSDGDGLPTTAVASGVVSVASTGVVEAVVSAALSAGLHWFAVHTESGTGSLRMHGYSGGAMAVLGQAATITGNNNSAMKFASQTYTGSPVDLTGQAYVLSDSPVHLEFRAA